MARGGSTAAAPDTGARERCEEFRRLQGPQRLALLANCASSRPAGKRLKEAMAYLDIMRTGRETPLHTARAEHRDRRRRGQPSSSFAKCCRMGQAIKKVWSSKSQMVTGDVTSTLAPAA